MFCIDVDLSERKRTEEALRKAHNELERRIEERTAELAKVNDKLRREIEERKRAEDSLRESQEWFRAIFETAEDSIFIKDRHLRYILVNPTMERLFGVPASQLLEKSDEELFGDEAGAHIREVDSCVLRGEIIDEEHTKPLADVPTTFHVIKVPIRDNSGEIIGLCGIARDITKQKQAEEALRKSYTEIEQLKDRLQAESEYLRAEIKLAHSHGEIVGESEAIKRVFLQLEQVFGSTIQVKYEVRDGKPVLTRLPKINFIEDKAGKPVGIHYHIGRRPIAAFGNSDGDFEMLEYTTAGQGARLAVLIHHDDAEREFAYDRKSFCGKLDRGLDEAPERGWVVVSMKHDWKLIFPFDKK
jgi:PAS domain S-box-containing protein